MGFRILTVVLTAFAVYSMVTCLPSNDWHFKGQNVALGKEASQKPATLKEYNPFYTSYPARLAVDGNDNNDFSQKSCSHTTSSEKIHHIAQWRVDLGDTYDITGIIIINRKDYRERLKYFIIYGKNYNKCKEWCELYNDRNISAYKNATIRIAVNNRQSYHTIAINLPNIDDVPDSGGFNLTLCEVKIFEAPRHVCETPKRSDKRNVVIYETTGLLVNGLYTVGTILQFSCVHGFLINGSNFVKCLSGGEFNQTLPVCTAACKVITVNNGRMMHPLQTLYTVNSHATIECNEGFLPRSQEITCQYGGHWNHHEQCKQVLCDYPERPNNGYYFSHSTSSILEFLSLPFGSIITGRCYEGYEGNDNDTRVCQGNKTWSGIPLTCTKKGCPFPGDLTDGLYLFNNGSLYMSGNSFYNTTIEVKCNKGYVVHGSKILRCSSNKTWSKVSTCQNVTCNLPERPVNKRVAVCISREGTVEASQAGLIGGITAPLVSLLLVSFVVVFFIRRRRESRQNKGEKPKRQANLMRRDNDSNRIMIHQRDGDYSEIQEAHSPSSSGNTSSRIGIKKESQSADTMYSLRKDDATKKPSFSSSVSLQSQNAYYSFTNVDKIPKTAIPMKDLPDLVLTGDVAKNKFEKEFQNLPQGMVEEHKEAMSRHNIGKNRYRNLYAYDNTRVVLDTDDNSQSDYINACYVHGFKKPKQYVASQGPTKDILTDFWRMIWQIECSKIVMFFQVYVKIHLFCSVLGPTKDILTDFWRMIWQIECSKVVMLTNIVEEGKTKCEQYWPVEGSTTSYGGITVDTENTENFSQFVIRTFKIRNETSTRKSKTITQFHFTAWPDRGVPKYASSLVQFLNKVKYAPVHGKGPIVVHCSAGVGRTGTFIALDYLTEQGKTMGFVDVSGTLASMRKQRVSLVQTLEQYIFVHQALIESLMLPTSALPAAKFPEAYQELLRMDREKKKRKIYVEFETLKKVSPVVDECEYMSAKLVRNRQKNRYSNVLPVEEFMPSLMSNSYNGDSRYINAVFLSSYKERKAFIITQAPLESTRDDFWGLVWEHDVHTIVMMNNISETTDSERYWPANDETTAFENIEITNDGSEEINDHQVVSLSVKKYKMTRKVKQIRCGSWSPKHNLPNSPEVILNLMELVQASQQQSGNHTILVHCMNGADKSGLYCVISAVIERMKIEQDVAISQVIEEMRNAREQIIPSVEQYQFCHKAVLAFIQQYDTYSNFTV